MEIKKHRALAFVLSGSLVLASCGSLLYPERKGQTQGRIDPAVAILNAAGLLLFIIPGLVAFAVDFHTGAIYLPGGIADANAQGNNVKQKGFDEKDFDEKDLKQIGTLVEFTEDEVDAVIKKELGLHNVMGSENLFVINWKTHTKNTSFESIAQLKKSMSTLPQG